jgi:hypothetical protein
VDSGRAGRLKRRPCHSPVGGTDDTRITVERTLSICRPTDPVPHLDVQVIAEKFASLERVFDERTRRLWAAADARAIGRGGISRVAEATGLSRTTIRSGLGELDPTSPPSDRAETAGRTRRHGGGRMPLTEHDPKLERALEVLVDPVTRATRCRPCGGRARVRPTWRPNSKPKAMP